MFARGNRAEREVEFCDALAAYKQTGNATLVVGRLPPAVRTALARRHFGAPDERRLRLLALTNGEAAVDSYLPSDLADADRSVRTTVRTHDPPARSDAESMRPPSAASPTLGGGSDLPAFGRRLDDAVEALHRDADRPFSPAQLRVSLDNLEPLLGVYGLDSVETFVGALTETVRDYRGMGQLFLPYPRSHPVVRALEPHFEIVLTTFRRSDDAYYQRWDLREYDVQEVLPLDE